MNEATILSLIREGCQSDGVARALSCQAVGITVQAPTVLNYKKIFKQAVSLKLLGLSDQGRNLEASCMYHNNIVGTLNGSLLPFAYWAWCCQPRHVALCISPDYTDSSRTGRY